MKTLSLPALIIALAAVLALVWIVMWPKVSSWLYEPDVVLLTPDDEAVVAHGKAVYDAQCAACHGDQLEGQPNWRERLPNGRLPAPPHDETGHTWHHPTAQLLEMTKVGPAAIVGGNYESDMPGFEGVLSDDDILAVLSFIKSTWPDEVRLRHDLIDGVEQ